MKCKTVKYQLQVLLLRHIGKISGRERHIKVLSVITFLEKNEKEEKKMKKYKGGNEVQR